MDFDKPIVLVIFGNSGHGKNKLAEIIQEFWAQPHRVGFASFAFGVKRTSMALLGISEEVAFGSQKLRAETIVYGKSVREWQQKIGTEIGREMVDENLWVERACDKAREMAESHDIVCITDGRFDNERTVPKDYLGEDVKVRTVLIRRPGHVSEKVDMSHPSEAVVASMTEDMFDYCIVNDGCLEELKAKAKKLLVELF